ncbi:MAG: LexA family protein [Cyclobacteriaceae bacterium]
MTRLRRLRQTYLLEFYAVDYSHSLALPLFGSSIAAGFPSPADDYMDIKLDLNEYLIKHPSATFFARVKGNSMQDAGIHEGDMLIVDRALDPQEDDVVVCVLDGEFTVKRIHIKNNKLFLQPANKDYPPIPVSEENSFQIWGVVAYVIHKP